MVRHALNVFMVEVKRQSTSGKLYYDFGPTYKPNLAAIIPFAIAMSVLLCIAVYLLFIAIRKGFVTISVAGKKTFVLKGDTLPTYKLQEMLGGKFQIYTDVSLSNRFDVTQRITKNIELFVVIEK